MEPAPRTHELSALLEHAGWVRSLARRLVADAASADDVCQETWLAALRRPPPEGRPSRAWLARVARNAARQLGRAGGRRGACERRAARGGAAPSAHELAERVALERELAGRVLALEEPYREALLLRFFEGLRPAQIARQQGVPVATVKTRLQRGLARLRAELDAGPGGRDTWLASLAPLVWTKGWLGPAGIGGAVVGAKASIGAGTVLFALALAWWIARSSAREPGEAVMREQPAAEREEERSALESAPLSAPAEAERLVASAAAEPARPEDRGVRLLVVSAETGDPVPRAAVWRASYDAWKQHFERRRRLEVSDLELLVAAAGARFETDDSGELRLSPAEGTTCVVARSGELYGQSIVVPDEDGRMLLELRRDRELAVQVVDEHGLPVAGVVVGVFVRDARQDLAAWLARTEGEAGLAVLRHLDHELGWDLVSGRVLAATFPFPLERSPEIVLDPGILPADPVRLVLPPTGRVAVRVADAAGAPFEDGWVHLTQILGEPLEGLRRRRAPRWSRLSAGGLALFEHVGLGLELEVGAGSTGSFLPEALTGVGPSEPGETVEFLVRVARPHPGLAGVALGPDGAFVPPQYTVDARVLLDEFDELRGPFWQGERGRVVDAGRFHVPVRSRVEAPRVLEVQLVIQPPGGGASESLFAALRLDAPLSAAGVDLGFVHFTPPPVAVSGVVVDQDGAPVDWAMVDLARLNDDPSSSGPPYDWLSGFRDQSDEDGRFAVHGVLEPGEYGLYVHKQDHLRGDFVRFSSGAAGLVLVLPEAAAVEGAVLVAEGVDPRWIEVEVRPSEPLDSLVPQEPPRARPFATGAFRIAELPPGPAAVAVRIAGSREDLLVLGGVHLVSGETAGDPRLAAIDLTRLLRVQELEIVDAAGAPIEAGVVSLRASGDEEAEVRRVAFDNGALALVTEHPALDVEAWAPGHRLARLDGARARERLVLERGIQVTVRVPAELALPAPPARLVLRLEESVPAGEEVSALLSRPADGDEVRSASGDVGGSWYWGSMAPVAPVDASRTLELELPYAGWWREAWSVEVERDGRQSSLPLNAASGGRPIRVPAEGLAGPLELAPDAEELARALEP